ncbi:MAG: NADP-dependent oxidoreductase [Pseudomonadota bacterium]
MSSPRNRRFILASRPRGLPTADDFRLEENELGKPGPGQVLVKNMYWSVDPYMRGRMSEAPSYAPPVAIGATMVGGTVGEVVESRAPAVAAGDVVVGYGGWQEYSVLDTSGAGPFAVTRVAHGPGAPPVSTALGACGMPGATAFFGINKLGEPSRGETVVISAAAGAVGSIAGQIAKMRGARVVGVAGGERKCRFVIDELGFDDCIDYKAETDLRAALVLSCPDGIDVYFENVGGALVEAVAGLLRPGARVPICGFISQYNSSTPVYPQAVLDAAPNKPASRFFLVGEWPDEYPGAIAQLVEWIKAGQLRYREDVVGGFENLPKAFLGLFAGENLGKRLVRLTA